MLGSGVEVKQVERLGEADFTTTAEFREPEDFAADEGDDLVVGGRPKDEAVLFEVVVAARDGDRLPLATFHQLELLAVEVFADGVHDGGFGVFAVERGQCFLDDLGGIDQRGDPLHGWSLIVGAEHLLGLDAHLLLNVRMAAE